MTNKSPINYPKLMSLIAQEPLTISSMATAKQAIAMMGEHASSYVLVMQGLDRCDENQTLVGILTERDVVRLSMQSHDLAQLSLQEVMSHPVVTIQKSIVDNINAALNLFRQYHIRHLPVLDGDRLIGLLSKDVLTEILAQKALDTNDINARKQAELDLQKNEHRYRALMDGASDAILLADPQGNLIEANQKAEELLGYSRDELKRLHISQIHPPEALKPIQNHFLSIKQNYFAPAIESLVLRKDGDQIPVEITGSCIELDGEMIAQGILRDIRDRKQAEIALWKANQELNYHIENSPLATIIWDPEFRASRWSARAEEIFGWKSDEVLGKTFFEWKFIYEPDIPSVQEVAAQILKDGKASCHNRNYRKDGSIIYCDWYNSVLLDEAGNLVSMTSLVQDVSERKRTEAALFDTKKRYQALFNHKTDAVFINSLADTGKPSTFIEVNDTACKSLGYSREELLTMTPSDIIPKDFVCDKAAMEKLRTQKYASSEVLHQTKDGRIFPVELNLVELEDNEGRILVIASAHDISDRKQAELALQESQHFLQKIADSSPNVLYLYDIQKQQNIYSNREVFSTFGYLPEELRELGENFAHKLMHPDDLRLVYPAYYDKIRMAQDGEIIESEYRMKHANGEWRWLYSRDSVFSRDENGLVKQIIGTAQDITERKNLEQTQKRLIAILEASTDYISMSDAKGNIFWKNAELKRLCGIDPHKKDVLQFRLVNCHPQWAVDLIEQQAIPKAIANGSWLGETALLDAEGREILVSQLILVHKSPQGEIEFFSSIMRDMRVYKEYEQQLERTNANLIRATSLKDEFLASMSHELRTPLNAILGMTEALQDDIFGAVNERQLKALQTIERSGIHLLELINDILDVSKIESGQMNLDFGFTNVNALCQSSIAFVKQQAQQKNIQIDERISQNLPDLWVDERRIRQVLINLLNNAVKFTAEGGRITLEVTQFSLARDPKAAIAKNFLRIAVIDTGIGIAPENIHKLFQPFVQIDSALNRKYTGTGLGLSLVKRVVELHGGDVGLTSELGVGSCFMIDLPYISTISQPDSVIDIPPSNVLTAIANTSDAHLVLLAEDNDANIATISSYLIAKDYRVIFAKNGQEAIALAKSQKPDIILMDIQMPTMDGLEATKQIRLDPNLVDIPIIALTALAMADDREKCLKAGANEYLTKPVKLKALSQMIQTFLAPQ